MGFSWFYVVDVSSRSSFGLQSMDIMVSGRVSVGFTSEMVSSDIFFFVGDGFTGCVSVNFTSAMVLGRVHVDFASGWI